MLACLQDVFLKACRTIDTGTWLVLCSAGFHVAWGNRSPQVVLPTAAMSGRHSSLAW